MPAADADELGDEGVAGVVVGVNGDDVADEGVDEPARTSFLTSGTESIEAGRYWTGIGNPAIRTFTRRPTEPSPVMGLKRQKIAALRLSFSFNMLEIFSLSFIESVFDFVDCLDCRARGHVEARGRGIDDDGDDVDNPCRGH